MSSPDLRREQYTDQLIRLFGYESVKGDKLARTITFQVTDDCCLTCSYCFPAGTQILMSDFSHKNIEDICLGDEVMGADVNVGLFKHIRSTPVKVTDLYVRRSDTLKITLEDGSFIKTTPDHPFYVRGRWIPARNIHSGNYLYRFKAPTKYKKASSKLLAIQPAVERKTYKVFQNTCNMRCVKVASVERDEDDVTVYNFATENHTYLANDVLVHNCYQQNKGHHVMTFDAAKKIIDKILDDDSTTVGYIQSKDSAGVVVEFIGGEPFMAIDLIDQISDYFIGELIRRNHPWATRYRLSICSNGMLYFDPKVQEYIKKNLSHLSFSISIDGNKQLHDACRVFPDGSGSYDRAIEAVRHFREHFNGSMGSKMTIAPENLSYIKDAVVSLIDNGYDDINLNCVYENVWNTEHATELYHQLKDLGDYMVDNDLCEKITLSIMRHDWRGKRTAETNYCGGTGYMIAVDWKGDIFPCIRYMESSLDNEQIPYCIGNVDDGIGQSAEAQGRIDLMNSITVSSQSEQKCLDCPISSGCGWCSAYNYQIFGTPNKRATYICQMHQARILATAHMWNRWFHKTNSSDRYEVCEPKAWALDIISESEYDALIAESEVDSGCNNC